jgi:hypothetical protein
LRTIGILIAAVAGAGLIYFAANNDPHRLQHAAQKESQESKALEDLKMQALEDQLREQHYDEVERTQGRAARLREEANYFEAKAGIKLSTTGPAEEKPATISAALRAEAAAKVHPYVQDEIATGAWYWKDKGGNESLWPTQQAAINAYIEAHR